MLDPRSARPLTSREISKVLSGIISGVVALSSNARDHVSEVVAAVIRKETTRHVNRLVVKAGPGVALDIYPTWACAFSATVAGLRGWCEDADIQTALLWVSENVNLICAPAPSIN